MPIKSDALRKAHGTQREPVNPYGPPGPNPNVFEEFDGIDTSTSRPGVDNKQMAWSDGWMPIGKRFLRTMYGVGTSIFTAPAGKTVVFYDFANIGATPIAVVFMSDGSIYQVNTSTSVATLMAAAGTITNPSRAAVGATQWGSQYVIIVSSQTNGYFLWDGSVFYSPGSLAPSVTVTNGGSGYTSAPTVTASGGAGSGATFVATVSGGIVTGIAITNPGSGYVAGNTVTLGFSGGGGSGAAATVTLMPYAISGTSVETYSGRVWIVNGAVLTFSAPGSFSNFATSSGGGNTTSSDGFLRVGYTQLKQTNGFLYLIADSSINYVSGVSTSGSPPVTTFTNQNADPETGTPWPGTVDVFGRNILFANAFGAHVSYGAAVTKISEALDGVYNSVANFAGFVPSAAKAIIFGKKCWILLLPIIDPISGQQVNKLFLWNGKRWWSTPQDVTITFIQHQEINSVLTAYGTNGTDIYPLFTTPSSGFTKVVQSKLYDQPGGYQYTKAANRLWALAYYYSIASPNVRISIDNELGSSEATATLSPNMLDWVNNSNVAITWTNSLGDPIDWFSLGAGVAVMPPTAVGQQGALTGLTISTESKDMALISVTLGDSIEAYRG